MIKANDTPASMIVGLGSYLPEERLTNDDIAQMLDTSDEWIRSRTGIGARHRAASNESNATMATQAARRAIADAGLSPVDIDFIIFGTMFPEYTYPGPGMVIQHSLQIGRTVPVLDIRVQCAGFIYAMSIADLYIRSGQARHVLCVFSEREFDHFKVDRQIGVIFGDGAGAAVLGPASGNRGIFVADIQGDGAGVADLVMTSDNMVGMSRMENHWPDELSKLKEYWDEKGWIAGHTKFPYWTGQEVFRNAVKNLTRGVKEVVKARGLSLDDVDHFLFHQANMRINSKVQELLGLPDEKVPSNIERIGNLGAASIPVLMDEEKRSGRLKPGDKCVLSAFGAGYLWGTAFLTI